MATATVTNVYSKGPTKSGKNGPGAVVFSDGVKLPTFSDADLSTAKGLIGRLAEYSVETKGQYTNLAGIKAADRPSGATPSQPTSSAAPSVDVPAVVTALNGVAAALREMASEYRKVAAGIFTPGAATALATAGALAPVDNTAAQVDALQKELAEMPDVGPEAAEAMFSALRKKHSKSPEKMLAAAAGLLKIHRGEAAA